MRTIPFGKYKGLPLSAIPSRYLGDLLENLDANDCMADPITNELIRRIEHGKPGLQTAPPAKPDLTPLFDAWLRGMVRRWHPDLCGSGEPMKVITDAAERLREILAPDYTKGR